MKTNENPNSQGTLNPSDASVIGHIKGTLIQFLKNTPLTEKNNEELLAIVFKMMEFTKEEIAEIQKYRAEQIKDPAKDKEVKRKAKKGMLSGMFKRKEKSGTSTASPSPMKPLGRWDWLLQIIKDANIIELIFKAGSWIILNNQDQIRV